jgi:hypothetical protein
MKKLLETTVLLIAMSLSAGAALAVDDVFHSPGQTTLTVGSNTITIENNVKYINYVEDDILHVTLDYTSTCNVVINNITPRKKAFTPKGVNGTAPSAVVISVVPAASGSITFDLQFTDLKKAGQKKFGMAHLNLSLNADGNCDGSTETPVNVGVQVSASTADHP